MYIAWACFRNVTSIAQKAFLIYLRIENMDFYVMWPCMMEEKEELRESYQPCLVAHCPSTCIDQNKYPERGGEKFF